jgi:hypothetical protein
MLSPDQHTLVRAIEDARRILGEHVGAGRRDATLTVQRLLVVLDRADLVHALHRVSHHSHMRLAARRDEPARRKRLARRKSNALA